MMPDNTSSRAETLACPICRGPLKRTAKSMLGAFECEQCGQFTEFKGVASAPPGRGPGSETSGSDPTG
jgi:hypothetical protein